MQEYKRERSNLESRLNEMKEDAAYHDEHLMVIDAWFSEVSRILPEKLSSHVRVLKCIAVDRRDKAPSRGFSKPQYILNFSLCASGGRLGSLQHAPEVSIHRNILCNLTTLRTSAGVGTRSVSTSRSNN